MSEEELIVASSQVDQDAEDRAMAGVIVLPVRTDVTEQKVLRNVKDVFKGFDPDAGVSASSFDTVNNLADYAQNTIDDIREIREKSEASNLMHKAAALCRFWYLGRTIDKALAEGRYGTSAVNKLAAALKKSVPYVYQIRAVATKLTVMDCYLLGVRGAETTHLRKLAMVKDDSTRMAIVEAFLESVKDTSDPLVTEQAKKALVAAVNADIRGNALDVDATTSDPEESPAQSVCREYDVLKASMDEWTRMLKRPSMEEPVNELCMAAGDFFMSGSVPNAEVRLEEIKSAAVALKALMVSVRNNIDDMVRELDSLQGVELMEDGDDASSGS